MPEPNEALVAYVPVIHKGYLEVFNRHPNAEMQVLDQEVLDGFSHLHKDVRALTPNQAAATIESLKIFPVVKLAGKAALQGIAEQSKRVVMPNDEVSRQLAFEYFARNEVLFESIFLRWHRENSFINVEVQPDRVIQSNEVDLEVINLIYEEANKSSDWWRRVGAALVKDNKVIATAHNHHLPTEHTPWIDGDPRNNAYRGVAIEAATAQHAEASIIARAARSGVALEGAELFVTTFPCPNCAKVIAESGIRTCYYTEGYAMTDGYMVLKSFGIEIVKVEGATVSLDKDDALPYPEKD